jgi:hypothetical protein
LTSSSQSASKPISLLPGQRLFVKFHFNKYFNTLTPFLTIFFGVLTIVVAGAQRVFETVSFEINSLVVSRRQRSVATG